MQDKSDRTRPKSSLLFLRMTAGIVFLIAFIGLATLTVGGVEGNFPGNPSAYWSKFGYCTALFIASIFSLRGGRIGAIFALFLFLIITVWSSLNLEMEDSSAYSSPVFRVAAAIFGLIGIVGSVQALGEWPRRNWL